jgi:hypothetical protein
MQQYRTGQPALRARVGELAMRTKSRMLPTIVMALLLCAMIGACVSGSGTVGGGNIPPETRFRVLGTPGIQFSGVISDTVSSWEVTGVIPLSIAILNNQPPTQMIASKLAGDTSLMSLEVVSGTTVIGLASTNEPFGSAAVQTGGTLPGFSPPSNPDTRFFLKGSPGQFVQGLIEDRNHAFEIGDLAPTLFLFENSSGSVDGTFQQVNVNFGPIFVDIILNGVVVASATGAPTVTIKGP